MSRKGIVFDLDGTLWNSTAVVASAWTAAVQANGLESVVFTPLMLQKVFGRTMTEIGEILFGEHSMEKQTELLEACYEYEHNYIEENKTDILYPKVKEVIQSLAKEYDLFIVSNCQSGYIELFLNKSGLGNEIKDIECFGNTNKSKGENIKLVMDRNGISDAVYVGDTIGDYNSSVYAGVPFIFASYGFGEVENPYKILNQFDQLPEILKEGE